MGRTFTQLSSDLVGMFAGVLPLPLAETYINDAWRDICDEFHWSFLRQKGVYHIPASVTTGTCTTTKGSKTVTFNAAAKTALIAANTYPLLTKRQFYTEAGDFYTIASTTNLVASGEIELDRIYRGSTGSGKSYTVARFYYGLPEDADGNEVTDFKAFISIINKATNTPFSSINDSTQDLDYKDPNRVATGEPYKLYPYKTDSNGNPMYEMYPHPTSDAILIANYISRFTMKSGTDVFPMIIPDALIRIRASWYACDWAMQNRGVYPVLRDVNWFAQKLKYMEMYSTPNPRAGDVGLLLKAIREDKEQYPITEIIPPLIGYPFGDDERTGYYSLEITTV